MNSGWLRVARGGSRATPALAARPFMADPLCNNSPRYLWAGMHTRANKSQQSSLVALVAFFLSFSLENDESPHGSNKILFFGSIFCGARRWSDCRVKWLVINFWKVAMIVDFNYTTKNHFVAIEIILIENSGSSTTVHSRAFSKYQNKLLAGWTLEAANGSF